MAGPPRPDVPLLIVLHGTGLDGNRMAEWTGLGTRGAEAGFDVVFPDAVDRIWDDVGGARPDGIDDDGFMAALASELRRDGGRVFLVGLSNGAFFAEHLARHGVVPATGIALVAGTARAASRERRPVPAQRAAALLIAGTGDRAVPYGGGAPSGLMARLARRRGRAAFGTTAGRETVAVESVAADWVSANGCGATPAIQPAEAAGVERLTWSDEEGPRVVLYRIEGGGHGWPGGPQYAPPFLVGRISRDFDATGAILDFAAASS